MITILSPARLKCHRCLAMERNQSFDLKRFRGLLYYLLFFLPKIKKISAHALKKYYVHVFFSSNLPWSSCIFVWICIYDYERKIIANVSLSIWKKGTSW